MDLTNITAKVKGFQRRTTQKVLQQMGMADKTEDDSPAFQNFLALGSFTAQLKATIQATDMGLEKACTAQTHLAGQIQSYLHSELSGDAELPPGELNDFFNSSDATRNHAAILQEISEKFYSGCSEISNNALQAIVGQLEDLVVKPILKDEEFASVTKELIEEKKKATLDYDSYRRMASSTNSPSEHEKIEAKMRAARDKYEEYNRRVADHVNYRNQIRCKLLIHGILTAMQQYTNYYAHAVDILRNTATSLRPLLDVYQMNEVQLQNTVNLGAQPAYSPNRAKSPTTPGSKVTADSLFTEYESQSRGPRPSAPGARGSPQQLDDMMRDNLNLKKPAAGPAKSVPMNQLNNNGSTRTPPPVHHSPQSQRRASPVPTHQSQTPPQNPPPQPFHDFFGEETSQPRPTSQSPTPKPPQQETLVNLMDPSPTPTPKTGNLFDTDLFGSGGFAAPPTMNAVPPMQPSNIDPFDVFGTPTSGKGLANEFDLFETPKQPQQQQKQQQQSGFNNGFGAQAGYNAQQSKPPAQNRPPPTQTGDLLFDSLNFGGPSPATAKPSAQSASGYAQPQPPINNKQQQQEERHELNPAITQKIQNWAERGGRKSNLRALLSTLHEVIWVDSGWDAMSLGDLITGAQVKKAYRRANLIVHPDKVQTGTVEQQLIAQRIFEALRVGHEAFKDEPQ